MFSNESMPSKSGVDNDDIASAIALHALVWTLADDGRARRLLDLTGLTVDDLRSGAGDPAILAAVLAFLAGYEPDLIACAADIGQTPMALIAAKTRLEGTPEGMGDI